VSRMFKLELLEGQRVSRVLKIELSKLPRPARLVFWATSLASEVTFLQLDNSTRKTALEVV